MRPRRRRQRQKWLLESMPEYLTIGTWNSGGLSGKDIDLLEVSKREKIDCIFVCETWAKPGSRPPNDHFVHWSPYPSRAGNTGRYPYGVGLMMVAEIPKERVKIAEGKQGLSVWWSIDDTLFGGVYLPPNMDTEECKVILTPPERLANQTRCVLMGDFNMRLGEISGDHHITERATTLVTWLMERGFVYRMDELGRPTFEAYEQGYRSSIVDHIWSNLGEDFHEETRVLSETDIGGSDHRLVMSRIVHSVIREYREEQNVLDQGELFALGKLKDEEVATMYASEMRYARQTFEGEFGESSDWMVDLPEDQQRVWIERMNDHLKALAKTVARDVLGNRQARGRRIKCLLKDENFNRARNERRRAFERVRRSHGLCEEARMAYTEAKRNQAKATAAAKDRFFFEFTDRVETMSDQEMSKVVASLVKRRTRGGNPKLPCDASSMESYATFFEGQFRRQPFHRTEVPEREEEETPVQEVPFTRGEIARHIRNLPKGKSPGQSGFRNELLIYAANETASMIYVLFQACWRSGMVPREWNKALIQPVPKKGDLSKIENHRPISLTETLRKLYERTILGELGKLVEPLDICQGGFRANRSTLDQIASLDEAIKQRTKTLGKPPVVAYLDIKAAYDTVDRRILWNILAEKGVRGELMLSLKALFEDNRSAIAVQGRMSREFPNTAGLLQGSILSPILYAVFIDKLPGRLRELSRFSFGETKAASFFYADDIAIIADSTEQMQEMLTNCEDFSIELGFRFSPTKCEIVADEEEERVEECRLYGQTLPRTSTFVYLGMTMNKQGLDIVSHIRRLATKAIDAANLMKAIGMNGYGFDIRTKRRIYETFIRPKLEYGLQLMRPSGVMIRLLERAQHYALCAMHSVHCTTSDDALRSITGIQSMQQRWEELNAGWATKVEQLGAGFMIKEALIAHGRRKMKNSTLSVCDQNPTVRKYRDVTIWRGRRVDSPEERKAILKGIRQERRRLDRERMFQSATATLKAIDEQRGSTSGLIDAVSSRHLRRALTLWCIGRTLGRPRTCLRCGTSRTTRHHVQQCRGEDLDRLMLDGKLRSMLEGLVGVLRDCMGWNTLRLETELAAEREIREARKQTLLQEHPEGEAWSAIAQTMSPEARRTVDWE